MTKVWIKYDPFVGKTELTVNDAAVDQNSGLYKYLDTPVEDWVNRLFPALMEHCNDDEIEMTFKGFLHHFQLLEAVHAEFSRKNTEYDIELHYESSPGPAERKEKLLKILAEIRQLPEMEDVLQDTALNEPMPVAVLGGTEEQRNALIEMIPGAIEPVDAEAAIHENLVLYLLAREWRQNDQQHMEWIAEQFRTKTKHRRRRFLFIAEDVSSAVRMLSSEAGIKKAVVFSMDEIQQCIEAVELYKEVIDFSAVLMQSGIIQKVMDELIKCCEKQRIVIDSMDNSSTAGDFAAEALERLDNVQIVCNWRFDKEKEINSFMDEISSSFEWDCIEKIKRIKAKEIPMREIKNKTEREREQKRRDRFARQVAFGSELDNFVSNKLKEDLRQKVDRIILYSRYWEFTVRGESELRSYLDFKNVPDYTLTVGCLTYILRNNVPNKTISNAEAYSKIGEISTEDFERRKIRWKSLLDSNDQAKIKEEFREELERYRYIIEEVCDICAKEHEPPEEALHEFSERRSKIKAIILSHADRMKDREEKKKKEKLSCEETLKKAEQLQNELRVLLEI